MRYFALFLAFWVLSQRSAGAAPLHALPPIRIGISNVQSGASQSLGRQLTTGSAAYFATINNSGGIYGRRVELILKDDRYEPEPAVENTNDLVTREKAFFLFDYVGTPTLTRVLPLLEYYKREKIVAVAPLTGADPQRMPPYDKYVFNIRASYREEIDKLVEYLYAKGYRRIGFLGQADAYGKSGEESVKAALESHGLKLADTVSYPRNQSFSVSMATQVKLLKAQGVDAVIVVGVYGPSGAFIRDARLSGWQVPIANVSFVNADAMLATLRAASRPAGADLTLNLINSQVVPLPNDNACPLVNNYRSHLSPDILGSVSLEGWLNAVVVTEALKRAGANPKREDFIRAMESLSNWDPGIGYKLKFSPKDHQGLHKVWLAKTERGIWTPIASARNAP